MILIGIVVVIAKSIRSGYLGRELEKRRTATSAHEVIPELSEKIDDVATDVKYTREKVDHVEEKAEQIDERVDRVSRTMAVVHAEDEGVDVRELRDRLDVDDLDEDLIGTGNA